MWLGCNATVRERPVGVPLRPPDVTSIWIRCLGWCSGSSWLPLASSRTFVGPEETRLGQRPLTWNATHYRAGGCCVADLSTGL